MKQIILDTNALVSFVTDRNLRQNEIVNDILKTANNYTVCIVSNVISEFVIVLDRIYGIEPSNISEMVKVLLNMPNVEFLEGYFPQKIFGIWPSEVKDFGDGVIVAASLVLKIPVYTFDKKFASQLENLDCAFKLLS